MVYDKLNFVTIQVRAQRIADAANVAYWTADRVESLSRHHCDVVLAETALLEGLVAELRATLADASGRLPAGEAVRQPQHTTLHDIPASAATGVGRVDALLDGVVVARADQGISLSLVHDDQREAEGLQPPAQRLGHAPGDAAAVAPALPVVTGAAGRLDLGAVAVGPADPVVQRLLTDAERDAAATQHGGEGVFVGDDGRSNSHVAPFGKDAPHGR